MAAAGTLVFPAPTVYTDLDQTSIDRRLRDLFASLFPTIDLDSEAELTRILFGAFAHVGDKLAYLINRLAREARLLTASQRRHLLGLVKLLGYRPAGARAATASLVFTLPAAHAEDVLVPAGSVARTKGADPVRFRTIVDLVIPAGALTGTVTAEHAESQVDSFVSTERAHQQFRLSRAPYVDESLVIATPAGAWTEVRNFLASKATDRHYTTVIDALDRCTFRFGDGRNGAIPVGDIDASYKTGGGSVGQLIAGALSVLESTVFDVEGIPVTITVANPVKTDGGIDRESDALIKLLAPESIRVPGSTIAREDFEIVARQVPGVARALMLARRQDPSVLFNEGFLFVVPEGGGAPSTTLLDAVAAQFGDEVYVGGAALKTRFPRGPRPKETTFQLRVRGASYFTVDVFAKIFLRSGFTAAEVKANVLAALAQFFAVTVDIQDIDPTTELTGQVPNPLINFGYYLQDKDGNPSGEMAWTDILDVVTDAAGVLKGDPSSDGFLLNGARADIVMARRDFPALGAVTLLNAATGLPL
ncbi:MAG: t4-like baseplate wedge [Rhodocyclaceae bacterium]|nr:MAG: t4-like baseplate wedge [Rhodocyclaceae bacterium]